MSFDFSAYPRIEIPEGRVKQIARASDGLVLWKTGYINQVPLSIDTDGSVYQGVGYLEGYRLSSSGSLKEQDGSVATGFIPCTPSDVIRLAGVSWKPTVTGGYSYIVFYDSDFLTLDTLNCHYTATESNNVSNLNGGSVLVQNKEAHNITTDENGITTFDLSYVSGADFAYIRISAFGSGEDMIVTINEEIA